MQRSECWRVATLNIWNRQGPWEQRKPLIRAWLETLDADVVGLQEILSMPGTGAPSMAADLVDGLGWHVHDAPAWVLGGGVAFGNAIVSRWPLAGGRTLALPTPPGLETRSCAFAFVEAPHGPMPVFVTHLSFQLHLGHVRVAQVKALAEHVAAIAPVGSPPPVLLGDFNAEPDSDEIRFLRGMTGLGGDCVYFADCATAATGGDTGPTYARDNRFALQAHEPSKRIDYIFVRGPDRALRGEPLSCTRALVDPVDGIWASDHYGVVADIAAAPRHHDA